MVEDKVTLITGASGGLGYEIVKGFAKQHAKVILTDVNEEKVLKTSQKLHDEGINVLSLVCDVTKEEHIKRTIDEIVARYGRIDVLINNAGIQHVSTIEEFPTAKFELLIKVMLTAPFITMKYALPHMKKQGSGRIINMASINGLVGFQGKAAYNSAKHGVIGLTKVAALEAAEYGVTVNALCPGYVDTPMVRNQLEDLAANRNVPLNKVMEEVIYPLVPQKRLLSPEEIANYTMYIASDMAKGITGQSIVIDGGYVSQ